MQDQKEAGNRHTTNAGDHLVTHPCNLDRCSGQQNTSEDVTQAELVARPLAPVSPNEEPAEESSTNNQIRESYMVDIQHNGKHVPFHCTDKPFQ